jgi:P27 family predicted phage terminase small subunit
MPAKVRTLRGGTSNQPVRRGYEPVPPEGELTQPAWMTDRARVVWDEVVPALGAMGYVYTCDTSMVVAFCEAEAERRRLAALVAASTPLLQGAGDRQRDRAELVRNPMMMMFFHVTQTVARLAGELGLSPRGRTELRFLSTPPVDERTSLLSG